MVPAFSWLTSRAELVHHEGHGKLTPAQLRSLGARRRDAEAKLEQHLKQASQKGSIPQTTAEPTNLPEAKLRGLERGSQPPAVANET